MSDKKSTLVSFDSLPLGARFKYPGQDGVFVKLENGGAGIVAQWDSPQLDWRCQGIYSFAYSEDERSSGMVEWLDISDIETECDVSGPDHPRQHDTMDIESCAGAKVQYMDCNGYPGDVEHCRRAGLVKDQVYEVVEVDVFDAHSNVRLKGFDGLRFNTVCFCSAQNTGDTQ